MLIPADAGPGNTNLIDSSLAKHLVHHKIRAFLRRSERPSHERGQLKHLTRLNQVAGLPVQCLGEGRLSQHLCQG